MATRVMTVDGMRDSGRIHTNAQGIGERRNTPPVNYSEEISTIIV
jgi:hypothetical protein